MSDFASDTLSLTGLDAAAVMLRGLSGQTVTQAGRKATRQGAKVLVQAGRDFAPQLSGLTRRNLKVIGHRPRAGVVTATAGFRRKDFPETKKDDWRFYPLFVILGHFTRSNRAEQIAAHRHGKSHGLKGSHKIPGIDWLGDAYRAVKEEAAQTTADVFASEIKKYATTGAEVAE